MELLLLYGNYITDEGLMNNDINCFRTYIYYQNSILNHVACLMYILIHISKDKLIHDFNSSNGSITKLFCFSSIYNRNSFLSVNDSHLIL